MSDRVPGQEPAVEKSELELLRQRVAELETSNTLLLQELEQLRQRLVPSAAERAALDESPEFLASWRR